MLLMVCQEARDCKHKDCPFQFTQDIDCIYHDDRGSRTSAWEHGWSSVSNWEQKFIPLREGRGRKGCPYPSFVPLMAVEEADLE
jgi:hypothetical protein